MVTIKDLAREAGVSLGTASNVINGKPQVSETNRKKVEDAIQRTGYRVNLHARGMILGRSFNVGIILPSFTELFYPKLADGIEKKSEQEGF
ncbi:MAG: LacI family DNA-binding transcriptional regulator, partial [Spirochaetota bacterium]